MKKNNRKKNKPFFLLIKPCSYDCNLHCDYCFYLCKDELYNRNSIRMSDEILETVMQKYLATDQQQYNICWQGGEPTLMGLDFYKKAVSYQCKYAKKNSIIANALQTNAVILNDEWCDFLHKYRFLVGVSLDGPADIHNRYRKTITGKDSYNMVISGLNALKHNKVEYNILTLVNSSNVKKPLALYRYLKSQCTNYIQFTPCVEFDNNGKLLPYAITGEQWGKFLCTIFDEWVHEDIGVISIRTFDAVLETLLYGNCSMCTMKENCNQYFVIEHNGDVYPCDFFVEKDFYLGNIMHNSWEELLENKKFLKFGKQKQIWHSSCNFCPYINFCQGDCQKNRYYGNFESVHLSWLCTGWKMFYRHAIPVLQQIINHVKM